jgi:hypothetical protein
VSAAGPSEPSSAQASPGPESVETAVCEHLTKAKNALEAAREDDRHPMELLEIARTQALVSIADSLNIIAQEKTNAS